MTVLWGRRANKTSERDGVLSAYEALAERYSALIDHKPHNAYYDRPNTLKLMGDVEGKHILDAGCGPGKYAEELFAKKAEVIGFDLSPKMVALAKERNGRPNSFFVHDLRAPLDRFGNEQFDMVVSALTLHYIEDWNPVIKEFHRVLKKDGSAVISIEHPFFEYTYFRSKKYFLVENVTAIWKGFGGRVRVPSYRRSLMECLRPFTGNGFYIDELIEPLPVPEFEQLDPRHFRELLEFPAFMCFRATKRS